MSGELEPVEDESMLIVADEADMDDEFHEEYAVSCTQALLAKREFYSTCQQLMFPLSTVMAKLRKKK